MLLLVSEREAGDIGNSENGLCRRDRLDPVVSMNHEWVEDRVRFGSALLALSFFFRLDLRVRFFIIWGPTSSPSSHSLM